MTNLENFGFELSDFQKISIKTIKEGDHVLVTAHTGSGKTLPAEFAIKYFNSKNKKVIYTAPIKALSNQKYYEFQQKFPNISFGILTGDVKFNPEADVLIMTTEILRNTLYMKRLNETNNLDFEMNMETELGCVVFDEVHYINDADRGKVWEETIMLLPPQVQMVMLSATIDKPECFAKWVEDIKITSNYNKKVILTGTNERVVPLAHYVYFMTPTKYDTKDPVLLNILRNKCNSMKLVKGWDGDQNIEYQNMLVNDIRKVETYHYKNKIRVTKINVINTLVKSLSEKNMLPAICFVFSRVQCHTFANAIQYNLLENSENNFELVQNECRSIISKLPNYKEYMQLPEYTDTIKLLEKGIAIHHSGIAPVLREMVEIMFSKGYIKLLFATETFAVGINMPTKTVIFTGLTKYSNKGMRYLHPHEYTQMAGRAGRRGLDIIGHVIHCCNMFDMPLSLEYSEIMNGKPQQFLSKFKISYSIILNIISENQNKSEDIIIDMIIEYISKSMINLELQKEKQSIIETINNLEMKIETKPKYGCDELIMTEYIKFKEEVTTLANKKRKRMESSIKQIELENNTIITDYKKYLDFENIKKSINREKEYLNSLNNYFREQIKNIIGILINNGYLVLKYEKYNLTMNGLLAMKIKEVNSLVLIDLLDKYNYFPDLSVEELISLMSCFVPINVQGDDYTNVPNTDNENLNKYAYDIGNIYDKYCDYETKCNLDIGEEYCLNYDLMQIMLNWCKADNEHKCKLIIQTAQNEKNIFLGEFIKSLVKISNVFKEMDKLTLINNNVEFKYKISKVNDMILKYVVSSDSLYL